MIIAVDFDGTIVEHKYPVIGKPVPGAIETMKGWNEIGYKIILFTMRSGKTLEEAVKYLEDNGVVLSGVNENPCQKSWTTSPKVYAHVYIDDAAFGCPLVYPEDARPYVDWTQIPKGFFHD